MAYLTKKSDKPEMLGDIGFKLEEKEPTWITKKEKSKEWITKKEYPIIGKDY